MGNSWLSNSYLVSQLQLFSGRSLAHSWSAFEWTRLYVAVVSRLTFDRLVDRLTVCLNWCEKVRQRKRSECCSDGPVLMTVTACDSSRFVYTLVYMYTSLWRRPILYIVPRCDLYCILYFAVTRTVYGTSVWPILYIVLSGACVVLCSQPYQGVGHTKWQRNPATRWSKNSVLILKNATVHHGHIIRNLRKRFLLDKLYN